MEAIKSYLEKVKSFSKFYEDNVYENLKQISNDIMKIFKTCFEQYGNDYGLVISNSVYNKIDLYDFTDRVKSPGSLEEKLVRKNIIFKLTDQFDICNLTEEKKDELKKYFYGIDDIIGIKAITSLNHDCDNVLKLLKEQSSNLDKISFCFDEDIPNYMRNGRKIYKIKCKYDELYSFEFQIKSKIDSAWGDLEHNIFYKDYDFNYVKNNNKDIMNNIGNLLEKIEDLMLSIRNSKKEFMNSYQKLNFQHNINNFYNDYTECNFKSKFILEENMDKLFHIYTYNIDEYIVDAKLIDGDIQIPSYKNTHSYIYKNYENIKKNNFEIPLLELIFFNWMKVHRRKMNDENLIKGFINGVLNYQILKVKEVLKIELMEGEIVNDIESIISNSVIDFKKANILIDLNSLAEFILLYVTIDYVKENVRETDYNDFYDLDDDKIGEFIMKTKEILFKCIFSEDTMMEISGDYRIFIDKLKQTMEDNGKLANSKKYQVITENVINMVNVLLGVGK